MNKPSDSFMMLALWMAWIFLRLVLARILEGKLCDARGRLLGDDLQALDHARHHFVFQAGVQAFGILAHDDEIDIRIARGNVRQIPDGPEVRVQLELLAQRDIDAGNPPPTGVVTGPFSPTRVRSIDSVSSLGMYSLILFIGFRAGRETSPTQT